jgi:hypothetical protein
MPLILRFFFEMCGVRINKKTDVNFFVTFLMRLMSTKAGTIQLELNKMRWWVETDNLDFSGCEFLLGTRPAAVMVSKSAGTPCGLLSAGRRWLGGWNVPDCLPMRAVL